MTDNEPAENLPGSVPGAQDQPDVSPLLDVLSGTDEPDAGRHALARPVPTPPDADLAGPAEPVEEYVPDEPGLLSEPVSEPVPGLVPEPDPVPTAEMDPAVLADSGSAYYPAGQAVAPDPAPAPVLTPPGPSRRTDLDPHPPTKAGGGTHVLGVLVGLVVGPVGAVALLLGQSRILAVQTDRWDADVDVFGIALVVVSALVLVALVLLAAWTAAAPVTGGVVTAGVGVWALVVPGSFSDVVNVDSGRWQTTVEQAVVAGTSGTLLAVGLLLLAAGIAAVVVRRAGVRLGAFAERTRSR